MKTQIATISLLLIFITAASFTSTRETNYKGRSELDLLYAKAKTEHRELAKFEEDYLTYQAKVNADRISINQKISARERLHQQAKSLISSIRNETIKKHAQTIQSSYYQQFNLIKKDRQAMLKPMDEELSITRDWLNAMKIAYSLEQNRLLEREIEEALKKGGISVEKVKELNAEGKRLVTKMLTPAD